MGELFNALGLDWKILLAQLVNFAILFFILYKVGYKPIIKFVQERTAKIEKGIQNAEEAEKRIQASVKEAEEVMMQARGEAQKIVEKAQQNAKEQAESILEQNREKLRSLAERTKRDIYLEQEKMMKEVKQQAAMLVLHATEKILKEKIDDQKDRALIEKALTETHE